MKQLFTYTLLTLAITTGCAQVKNAQPSSTSPGTILDTGFTLVQVIPGNFSHMEVDAIGNVYLLNEGQLKKISPSGDSLAVFNDVKRFGIPNTIDVSNPFKTLLFYKPYATIVLLDNMLSNRGVVNLRKSGIFTVKATGVSYDNKIWVFDEQDFKLKKLDEEGKLLFESNDLRQAASIAPQPESLVDHEGMVYLYDSLKGFIILDYYGAFVKVLPFTGWQSVSVAKNRLYGFQMNKFFSYELNSLQLKEYKLPQAFAGSLLVRAMGGKVYLLKKGGVEIYTVR